MKAAAEICIVASASAGQKIISCGNGGSLCDATHFAEELTGRFRGIRRPLPAMAINDPAYITCAGNDFAYDEVFARWVKPSARKAMYCWPSAQVGTSPKVPEAPPKPPRARG